MSSPNFSSSAFTANPAPRNCGGNPTATAMVVPFASQRPTDMSCSWLIRKFCAVRSITCRISRQIVCIECQSAATCGFRAAAPFRALPVFAFCTVTCFALFIAHLHGCGPLLPGQNIVLEIIDLASIPFWNHDGHRRLLHDRGPVEHVARPYLIPVVDRRIEVLAVKTALAPALERGAGILRALFDLLQPERRLRGEGLQPQRQDFDRLPGHSEGVQHFVLATEACYSGIKMFPRQLPAGDQGFHLVELTDVAHVCRALERNVLVR